MQISAFPSTIPIFLEPFFPPLSKEEGKDLFFNESKKPSVDKLFELKIDPFEGKTTALLDTSTLKFPRRDLKPIDTSVLLQPTRAEMEAEHRLQRLLQDLSVTVRAAARTLDLVVADLARMRAALAAHRVLPHT